MPPAFSFKCIKVKHETFESLDYSQYSYVVHIFQFYSIITSLILVFE